MADTYQRVLMRIPDTTASWESWVNLDGSDARNELKAFVNWLQGVIGGRFGCDFDFTTGASYGTATLTSTGAATATETCTICAITFTARASGATGNEFNVSATPATQAANIAAAVNASTDLTGVCTASSALGVTTITSAVPGAIGNGLEITESLTNVALSDFVTEDTGADTTEYSVDLY